MEKIIKKDLEIEEARFEYNSKQTRPSRMIDNYFDNVSNNEKIDMLKTSKLNKDNYILSKEDKDSYIGFIDQVNDISKEYDRIQTLSNTLVNAHEQLKDKNNKIKALTENNEALNLRVKTLNDTIKEKDNEISFLKSEKRYTKYS